MVSPYKASSNQIVNNDNTMNHGKFWCKMNSIKNKIKSVTKFSTITCKLMKFLPTMCYRVGDVNL
jgi:hypothetical protein